MYDPLSDVFQSLRLSGALFLDATFTAPYSVLSHMKPEKFQDFMPGVDQIIGYHVVIDGVMRTEVAGEPPLDVGPGEIVLLPRNDPHTVSSGHGLTPIPTDDLVVRMLKSGVMRVKHGGGGSPTKVICGFLGAQGAYNPLFAALPPLLKIDVREAASRGWIETSVRFAAEELARGRMPNSSVVSRLSEVLLVEAMREYSAKLEAKIGDAQHGWMRGLKDPQIARALAVIHRDIAAPLTAEDLAKEAALSRSAFIDRFSDLIGMPPIRYLTLWRLEAAKRHLQDSQMSIDQIAFTIGYESEEGFRRAFKREIGESPARWRAQKVGQGWREAL